MLKTVFTLDYEIHGNGEGCPFKLMVEPTERMLDLFDRYGAKLTIMADVAEVLKFKEYKEQTGRDDFHYDAITEQLKDAIRRGHDVQLHLHASYFNACYKSGRWEQDWSEYNFAGLPPDRINQIVRIGKEYLEALLKPVLQEYECFVFRAANWSVSPSRNVIRALLDNGIQIDTSVFKYGRREGIVSFNYENAPSNLMPWTADENDICRENPAGRLLEIPIYCERRWLGAFLSLNRFYRAHQTHRHLINNAHGTPDTPSCAPAKFSRTLSKLSLPFRQHAWKADFNQCGGGQLSRALRRAAKKVSPDVTIPFVLIGHSKLFNSWNARSLEPFLACVRAEPRRFSFGKFEISDLALFQTVSKTSHSMGNSAALPEEC